MGDKYTILQQVGQGAHGCVWKATLNGTTEFVAIKQLKSKSIAKRYEKGKKLAELVALEGLKDHPNIIQLKEVIQEGEELFYVYEYMPTNLWHMMKSTTHPSKVEIQSWMRQILQAVAHMHSKAYIHRDLKPENILANENTLKVADLGSTKKMGPCLNSTNLPARKLGYCGRESCTCGCATTKVGTRWYRAPKILLGSPSYSTSADMWSLGVIMAEMFLSGPLFPSTSEQNQFDLICLVFGVPHYWKKSWTQGARLARKCKFEFKNLFPVIDLGIIIPDASDLALNLIESLMAWHPQKRLIALEALDHPFFKTEPITHEGKSNTMSSGKPQSILHPIFLEHLHTILRSTESAEETKSTEELGLADITLRDESRCRSPNSVISTTSTVS